MRRAIPNYINPDHPLISGRTDYPSSGGVSWSFLRRHLRELFDVLVIVCDDMLVTFAGAWGYLGEMTMKARVAARLGNKYCGF